MTDEQIKTAQALLDNASAEYREEMDRTREPACTVPGTPMAKTPTVYEHFENEKGMFFTYSNNSTVSGSSVDLRIRFSELVDGNETKVIYEDRVQITMTWAHAKSLALRLQQLVNAYEGENGEINLNAKTPVVKEDLTPRKCDGAEECTGIPRHQIWLPTKPAPDYLCCRCHIRRGGIPADWHSECMAEAAAEKIILDTRPKSALS